MDEDVDRLVIAVRADTASFAGDVAAMKASLEQGVGAGADRAGRTIEAALARAVRSGKLGFDDLGSVALKVLGEIAGAAIRTGIGSVVGGTAAGAGSGGLIGTAGGIVTALLGLPGRATGGPVSPGAAYLVGERGPELFVPTASGSVATLAPVVPARGETATAAPMQPAEPAVRATPALAPTAAPPPRDVRISIAINAGGDAAPRALAKSGRQVARAVTRALQQAEG